VALPSISQGSGGSGSGGHELGTGGRELGDVKAYRRHTGGIGVGGPLPNDVVQTRGFGLTLPTPQAQAHLLSSCSASHLPHLGTAEPGSTVTPRLSKSEENLIDLETPTQGGGLGFTLENPLYDLVTNNVVFEDIVKTDDELIAEYGLNSYFDKLNLSSTSFGGSRRTSGISNQSQNSTASSSDKWTKFD